MALLCTILKRLNIPNDEHSRTNIPWIPRNYPWQRKKGNTFTPGKDETHLQFVTDFLTPSSMTKNQSLQIVGHFHFASTVVLHLSGWAFTSYLINLSTLKKKKTTLLCKIHSSKQGRSRYVFTFSNTLEWCVCVLWIQLISSADMELYTEASSTIGFCGYYKGKWFAEEK